MKLKATHYIGALLVVLIAISGYYLYQQQLQITGQIAGVSTNLNKFETYAQSLGLNVQQFSTCLDSKKYLNDVTNDFNDGRLYGVEGTPTFFINGQQLVGALPITEFQSVIDAQLAKPNTTVQIRTGSNPMRGTANAPITIVMFSDYQCPYCAAAESSVEQVLAQYQGKIQLYYRDFPLSFHQYSQQAALASRCAGEQGRFWEYHDMLFANQAEWSAG